MGDLSVADVLEGLAARCESASGPDRELDALIRAAVFAPTGAAVAQSPINGAWCTYHGEYQGKPRLYEYPGLNQERRLGEFTASLDAAMTLVPEECGWIAGWGQVLPDEPMGGAQITRHARFIGYGENYDTIAVAEAVTPALALCAAALRAAAAKARAS
jgi:hypothetical protein